MLLATGDLEEDKSSVGIRGRRWEPDCGKLKGAKEPVGVDDFAEESGSERKLRNSVVKQEEGQRFP